MPRPPLAAQRPQTEGLVYACRVSSKGELFSWAWTLVSLGRHSARGGVSEQVDGC